MEDNIKATYTLNEDIFKEIKGHLKAEILFGEEFITKSHDYKISTNIPEDQGGLYTFWWRGDGKILLDKDYILAGPNHTEVIIRINQEWLKKATHNKNVALYVGKTTKLRGRILDHIKANSPKESLFEEGDDKKKKHNSVSQLRYGIERLLNNSSMDLISKNVGLSFYPIVGPENAVNRFYLEDYLIGEFTPLLNVDIER
jgi:hypothetical protein